MMRKLILVLAFMLMLFANPLLADKIVPLPGLFKPNTFAVDDHQIYIADGTSVCIYSLTDFTLKTKFGREGEGPKEFKRKIYLVDIQQDYITVNSDGKISFFTKEGKFIKEIETPPQHRRFRPLGKKFTGAGALVDNNVLYNAINIYGANLKKEKEIARIQHEFQSGKGTDVFARTQSAGVCENKLLVAGQRDFIIDVFDENGKKLYSIKRELEKINVTQKDKDDVMHFLKTNPETKFYFEMLKPIKISDRYPAIREIAAADKKFYVITWKKKEGKSQCLIFDLDGKFLKEIFLPLNSMDIADLYPLAVKNGKLYQLVDNTDTEEWELHITEIK